MWLYDVLTGRLIRVDCGIGAPAIGGASNSLTLDSPDVDTPLPAIWVGVKGDLASRRHADLRGSVHSYFPLDMPPGPALIFTVSQADSASVALTYYRRWHTWASEPPAPEVIP